MGGKGGREKDKMCGRPLEKQNVSGAFQAF